MAIAEASARPAEIATHLTAKEHLFREIFNGSPTLTPVHALQLIRLEYPGYKPEQLNDYDIGTMVRPTISRLRDKLADDNLTIYGISHFSSYILGPIKTKGETLTLTQLPPIVGLTLPQEPKNLLKSFF